MANLIAMRPTQDGSEKCDHINIVFHSLSILLGAAPPYHSRGNNYVDYQGTVLYQSSEQLKQIAIRVRDVLVIAAASTPCTFQPLLLAGL